MKVNEIFWPWEEVVISKTWEIVVWPTSIVACPEVKRLVEWIIQYFENPHTSESEEPKNLDKKVTCNWSIYDITVK